MKTLEKIKRKTFRKSLEKEKAISAQVSPAGPARARAPARRTLARAHSSPLPLAAQWGRPIDAEPSALVATLARCSVGPPSQHLAAHLPLTLAGHGPHLSATPLFPNLPPALSVMDAPTTACFPATTSAPEPFSAAHAHSLTPLAQLRPQPSTLAPSLALRARPWNSAEGSPPFCGHHRASVASVCFAPLLATWDTSWLAPSLSNSLGLRSMAFSPCNRSPPSSTQAIPTSPSLSHCSRVSS